MRKQSTLRWFGRTLLALIDAFVSIEGYTQLLRREHNQPSADEILDELIGQGVYEWI